MTVTEYLHEFNRLARYAPEDVRTDAERWEKFLAAQWSNYYDCQHNGPTTMIVRQHRPYQPGNFSQGNSGNQNNRNPVPRPPMEQSQASQPQQPKELGGKPLTCFNCGDPGHFAEIQVSPFLANLILVECKDLDVILGMDWLTKHNGVIDCASRTVTLVNGKGEVVVMQSPLTQKKGVSLNQVESEHQE
uniref:OSJNBa0011K22.1 protein n=2 Tax=Oryza sativa subsp. japonica TaxID=39947 RepID=A0A5S6RAH6_ORYSJ|nr:OSJNBa0011K22.1 [Oryza sativa Japonica Group]CAE05237.1 OSJNBa0011K22.20 [Oryza sativa Japonica Group]CAE75958.1 B1159F04.21 [Oryza sativa Japonica Group]